MHRWLIFIFVARKRKSSSVCCARRKTIFHKYTPKKQKDARSLIKMDRLHWKNRFE